MPRRMCTRWRKNDAGISGRLLALHPPTGRWRLHDAGWRPFPHGERCKLWFDRTVSADAAGIILTSLVINRQLWLYHDSGDAGLTQLYRMRDAQLWRHIEFHPECNAIYAALD